MTEQKFATLFKKWLVRSDMWSGAYELKVVKGNSIPFNNILDHQVNALKMVKEDSLAYKIPDDSISYKPFDIAYFKGLEAYVVIHFNRSKNFYIVDIDDFLLLRDKATRKSLTEDMLKNEHKSFSF